MKCLFESSPASTEAEICIGCKKRGSKCVSQTFDIPDEIATPKRLKRRGRMNGDGDHERVLRLKALVEQLTEKVGSDGSAAAGKSPPIREHGWEIMPTPVSIDSGSSSCEKTFSDVRTVPVPILDPRLTLYLRNIMDMTRPRSRASVRD